jgi:hypothetical protein
VPVEVREVERVFGDDIFVWREGLPTGSAAITYRGEERMCVATGPVLRSSGGGR